MFKPALALALLITPFSAAAQSRFDDDSPIGSRIGAAASAPVKRAVKAKPAHAVAADGFWFERKSEVRAEVRISLVLYPNEAELNAAKDRYTAQLGTEARPDGATVHAFSIMRGDRCEIHTVDPAALYRPEYDGHELFHCMFKEHFHPSQAAAEERR